MIYKVNGIITGSINYSEKSVVLRVFTDQFGLLSFMVPGVRGGKGQIRPSHIMPLTLVELVIYKKETEGLHRIKELRCNPPLIHLHADVRRSSIAVFMCELLQKALQEHEQDEQLYMFLRDCILHLETTTTSVQIFPLYFMLGLGRYFGFLPKGDLDESGMVLDLEEGVFTHEGIYTRDRATPEQSYYIYQLLQQSLESYQQLSIPYAMRLECLDVLVRYIQKHMLHSHEIKSHAVLHEVMS